MKAYAQNLGLSGYGQLKERITEQLNQSERILQQHFDPHRTVPDRPDRLLKTRELATLLEFYLDRSVRYGLMVERAAEEARTFLDLLEQGYTLRFTRSGLVFDFDKPGTEPPEREVGIEFHRIGSDLIRALVDQAAPRTQTKPPSEGGDGQSSEGGPAPTPPEGAPPRVLPIPRLDVAAFLVGERHRITAADIQLDAEAALPAPVVEDKSASLTLAGLRKGIEDSGLSDHLKELALLRLRFAEEYVNDQQDLTSVLRPGRLVIVDLRDELVEKDEALGLFVVLLQMFGEATYDGRQFNKLVVFDEAHKYIDSPDLAAGLVEVVREMRHKGTSILVASQDPPSVPASLIELSSQIILHKFNSPSWLKHIQKANAALEGLTPAKLAALGSGEAYVWSSKATDDAFTHDAVKVRCRPRVTRHGGATKTAVSGHNGRP